MRREGEESYLKNDEKKTFFKPSLTILKAHAWFRRNDDINEELAKERHLKNWRIHGLLQQG